MAEGYKFAFANIVTMVCTTSFERAFGLIERPDSFFNVVLIDIDSYPSGADRRNWERFSVLTRSYFPSCKILVVISCSDSFTLFDLTKRINPEGLLLKADLTIDDLLLAHEALLQGSTYHGTQVKKSLAQLYRHQVLLDDYNRRIIILLSRGIKTKNLPQHLNLSISAIDKRKAQIKEILDVAKGTDEDIIREAKNNGLI